MKALDGVVCGLLALAVGLWMQACAPAPAMAVGVGSDSPEDRWRNDKGFNEWQADVAELLAVGADEVFVVLDNLHGDGRNTTPWLGGDPSMGVDHAFLDSRALWVRYANGNGVRVEVAFWEEETAVLPTQAQRVELARAVAAHFRGLDVLLCISEEVPPELWGEQVEELVCTMLEEDPAARVTVHNGIGSWEPGLLGPLAAAQCPVWGVSGQISQARDTTSFLQTWRPHFARVRVVEVGPWNVGIAQVPDVEDRRYFWTSALAGESVRIYKGTGSDVHLASILPWAEAYRQATVAQQWNDPSYAWRPDKVFYDGSCSEDGQEFRVWWPDGDGRLALPAGTWYLRRYSTITGQEIWPVERVEWTGGTLQVSRPSGLSNTDGLIVLRSIMRDAQGAILGRVSWTDHSGDGVLDVADMIGGD